MGILTIILFIVYLFLLYIIRRTLNYLLISPIYIYLIFYTLVVILTIPYFYFYEPKFSIVRVDQISSDEFLRTINLYFVANIAFLGGFIVYYDLSTRKIKRIFNTNLNFKLFKKYKIPKSTLNWAIVFVFIILLFYGITYKEKLFFRNRYIPILEYKYLITIAKILSFAVSILLGLYFKKNSRTSMFLFFLVLIPSLATGSRATFLMLIIYFVMIFQSSGNTLLNKIRFMIQLIFSFIFLSYLMSLRSLDDHGLVPYIQSVFSDQSTFISSLSFNTYYTFIFGVFASAKTMNEAVPDWHIIYLSLNPMLGKWIGWSDYIPSLMITRFMPYPMHGQIFTMGLTFSILFFFTVGMIFSYFENKIRVLLNNNYRMVALVIVLLLALFVFYSFEYHLRSAFRYIYYALFVYILFNMIRKLRKSKFKTTDNDE